jgi:drug/metabolite transporter (DMT)-like permease
MKAMETGPLSFSVLALSFGIVLPVVYGGIFWNEAIRAIQVVGLFLLFATFILFAGSLKISAFPGRKRWVVFCLWTFAGNGIGMILVKSHQIISGGRQVRELLLIAFATAAIVCLAMLGTSLRRKRNDLQFIDRKFIILGIAAGLTTAAGNYFSVYLNSRLPGIIQFPVSNGGVALASTICSRIIFKEKINRRGLIGIATGISALLLLSLN